MIKKYSQFISDLIHSINNKNNFTWSEFGCLMKDTAILVLFLLFLTVGLYGLLYFIPQKFYQKSIGKLAIKMKDAFENTKKNFDEYYELKNKILKRKILFGIILSIIYVPFIIPILLMCINLLF